MVDRRVETSVIASWPGPGCHVPDRMVPGRVDPTVHESPPRDRGERLGGGTATAATGPPDGRENPAAGHEPRASGPRASSPPTRAEDPDTTDRRTGPARPRPRPRRRARRACDRRSRPRRPLPRETIHDDRQVGESPPGRTMRDAAHPSHPGRGGGDAPASRPGRPGRSGAGHDPSRPVPGRPTGNRTRRHHDPADHAEREASTPPRAGPARTRRQPQARSDPSKNPTMTAAGSSPRRAVEDPGRLRRAQQPDPDASTHRHTDRTGRSPPPRRMRRRPAPTRTPGRRRPPLPPGTRSPRGPPGAPPSAARSRRAPPRSRHQRRDRGTPSAVLRPGPRPPAPQDHTIRPPRPPARTPGTIPRTTRPLNPAPHPGTDTTQPHLTITSTHRPKNTKHSSRARRGRGRLRVGSVLYGGFRAWAGALSWESSLDPVEATASRSDRVCSWRMARYCAPWSGWWIGPVGSAPCRRCCRIAVVGASGAGSVRRPVGACRSTFRRGCASAGGGGVHPLRERARGGDVRHPRFVRSGGREVLVHQVCRVLLPWSGPGRSGRLRAAGAVRAHHVPHGPLRGAAGHVPARARGGRRGG